MMLSTRDKGAQYLSARSDKVRAAVQSGGADILRYVHRNRLAMMIDSFCGAKKVKSLPRKCYATFQP